MQNIKIKICAMREPDNIKSIYSIRPDFVGFVFDSESEQYIGENPNFNAFESVSKLANKVAVYTNEKTNQIVDNCKLYGFQYIQLNGDETITQCQELRNNKLTVIKTFLVDSNFNFARTNEYISSVDYFMFNIEKNEDTKNIWQILNEYKNKTPFFLGGKIEVKDAETIMQINHPQLFAVDLNNEFEIAPAIKDNRLISIFKYLINKDLNEN